MNPIEPKAATRQAAHELREMHVALLQEGFTPAEAMHIIGITLSALFGGQQK